MEILTGSGLCVLVTHQPRSPDRWQVLLLPLLIYEKIAPRGAGARLQRTFYPPSGFHKETGHCVPSGGRVTQGAELGSVRTRDSYSGVSTQFSECRLSPKSDHSLPPPTAALPQ